ncbi:hypothetical protein EAI80_01220 [Catenibacterium sp. co_0103]|uniref:hypothetical protein n=1 Tax=unclassified Catenibacterium TaxID=2643636 RepID=UPI00102215E2|nr:MULTISPECIES: hypothetical protein [unclassified Catenibacterium]MZT11332.1 hypothetical protein [Catenibacterium sp. BIOML-A1]RYT51951.1 hypothetical protein EAI80_01220 [Catenibacterium sp. co_0103]
MKENTNKTITRIKRRLPTRLNPAIILLIAASVTLLFPQPVHAAPFWEVGTNLKNMVCEWLLDMSCWGFNLYNDIAMKIGSSDMLSAPFDSLLGVSTYELTKTIHQTAVIPIAESILALFMLVQLVKISQRIDATATLPAVKDIVFLAVVYVLIHWFIVNSLDIMQAIYKIAVDNIIPEIGTAQSNTGFFNGELTTSNIPDSTWDELTIGGCFLTLCASILSGIGGVVAYMVAFIVAYARAWQIYAMAAFSSIPIALLGFDETRQMGIGFLKNFAAAVLAGAVMMFLLVIYPLALSTMTTASGVTGGASILFLISIPAGGTASLASASVLILLEFLAITFLLIIALIKSGAWAKEILGS